MTPASERTSGLERARELGCEEVLIVQDRAVGLLAAIALHDTTLGPAVGGTRMHSYPTLDEAVIEAARLGQAMTAKAALAGLPYGGAKAVIVGDPAREKTPALLAAYARAVERLGGRFFTGCDMGIDGQDLAYMTRFSSHFGHAPVPGGIDASDLAALGVFAAIRATARELGVELAGLRVALQGLGQVGMRLARRLAGAGTKLTVTDVDAERVDLARSELSAEAVDPDAIYDLETEIFSPCAAGDILNDATLPRLRCRALVGAANLQLAEPRPGDELAARGILYAPDYLVNAGGLLSLLYETGATDEAGVCQRVEAIGEQLATLFAAARAADLPPHRLADQLVAERLAEGRLMRRRAAVRAEAEALDS